MRWSFLRHRARKGPLAPPIARNSGVLALGIHWAHDASVAVCSPSGCLFALAEERVTRIKHHYGFPMEAIHTAFRALGIRGTDIDIVAISTRKPLFPFHRNYVSVELDGKQSGPALTEFRRWRPGAPRIASPPPPPPPSAASFVGTAWEGFATRHWTHFHEAMNELGLLSPRIRYVYVAHHRAHAASTFRLAGMSGQKVCVVTLDGKGDGCSGSIYVGHEDGRLELLRATPAEHSLGSFYQAITEALGFIPVDGEYKTMGLAALGTAGLPNPFDGIVDVRDGMTRSRIPWTFRSYNAVYPDKPVPNPLGSVAETELFRADVERHGPAQLAYFAQEHLEHTMVALIRDALRLTATRRLAVAGGVMLNVKANSRVREELRPICHFVFPDSADSGLSMGAAMEGLYVCGATTPASFPSPYLGHEYTDQQITAALAGAPDLEVDDAGDRLPARMAMELVHGRVIGTFQGRLEAGPRALGNRSVLADPRDLTIRERINHILKGREWFVPFAPIVLEDEAKKYWCGSIDYRHMTFTVTASDFARQRVPGVVHVDGTMRPQVVNGNTNRWLHAVLEAFRELTEVGVLINTSFNRHGLPIVGAPADALDHLRQGWVDGLAIGPYYVTRKT
jgi:carbamoyltransferase